MIIKLDKVYGGRYVRDLWCTMPYKGNPAGCPQTQRCRKYPLWRDFTLPPYHLVVLWFNLKEHTENLKKKFPTWSEKQLRNSRLWQGHQDKLLKDEGLNFLSTLPYKAVYISRPEEYGINVMVTARKVGIKIEFPIINVVRCVGLIGKAMNSQSLEEWFE